MQEQELKRAAEKYLGADIECAEWDKAKENAERKLERTISREGDAGGRYRESWYLAMLIAEAVRASRFSEFTIKLYALRKELEEEYDRASAPAGGVKKEQPVSQNTGRSIVCTPIVAHQS